MHPEHADKARKRNPHPLAEKAADCARADPAFFGNRIERKLRIPIKLHAGNHQTLDIRIPFSAKRYQRQNVEDVLYLDELKEALAYNRDCNIIWAHIGISRRVELQNLSKIADELLADNPNLYVDISWVVYDYYFLDKFPDNYSDGDSLADWVKLIEKYPDRVMIGTDKVGHWETYPSEVVKYYKLLDRLDDETVKKVTCENALSLVKKH